MFMHIHKCIYKYIPSSVYKQRHKYMQVAVQVSIQWKESGPEAFSEFLLLHRDSGSPHISLCFGIVECDQAAANLF